MVTQAHKAEYRNFGGSIAVKRADLSGAMVRDKIDALEATGDQPGRGHLMHINGALAVISRAAK